MDFLSLIGAKPPLVLGLDPRPQHHPAGIGDIRAHALSLMEALKPYLAAVKPQAAFFEALGAEGYALFIELAREARAMGLPVLFDVKRGDVPSTASAYARAYLEAFPGSAVTVSPLLGEDSLLPFFEAAAQSGGMVFVLVRTSNPGAGEFFELETERGMFWEVLLEKTEAWNRCFGGRVGAVIGATHEEALETARERFAGWILAPGVGAQGGEARPLARVLYPLSRALMYPGGKVDVAESERAAKALLLRLGF